MNWGNWGNWGNFSLKPSLCVPLSRYPYWSGRVTGWVTWVTGVTLSSQPIALPLAIAFPMAPAAAVVVVIGGRERGEGIATIKPSLCFRRAVEGLQEGYGEVRGLEVLDACISSSLPC